MRSAARSCASIFWPSALTTAAMLKCGTTAPSNSGPTPGLPRSKAPVGRAQGLPPGVRLQVVRHRRLRIIYIVRVQRGGVRRPPCSGQLLRHVACERQLPVGSPAQAACKLHLPAHIPVALYIGAFEPLQAPRVTTSFSAVSAHACCRSSICSDHVLQQAGSFPALPSRRLGASGDLFELPGQPPKHVLNRWKHGHARPPATAMAICQAPAER